MAFIDEFQKLVRTIGGQPKIQDKDKAILEIASQVSGGVNNNDIYFVGNGYYPVTEHFLTSCVETEKNDSLIFNRGMQPDGLMFKNMVCGFQTSELSTSEWENCTFSGLDLADLPTGSNDYVVIKITNFGFDIDENNNPIFSGNVHIYRNYEYASM